MRDIKVITNSLITNRGDYVVIRFLENDIDGNENYFYGTINKNDLDENGKTKRVLNGLEMLIEKDYNEAINDRIQQDRCIELVESGVDTMDAVKQVYLTK